MSDQGLFVFFFLFLFLDHNDLFFFHLMIFYLSWFSKLSSFIRQIFHDSSNGKKTSHCTPSHSLFLSLYEINFIMNYSLFRSYIQTFGLFYFFGFFVCVVCVFSSIIYHHNILLCSDFCLCRLPQFFLSLVTYT